MNKLPVEMDFAVSAARKVLQDSRFGTLGAIEQLGGLLVGQYEIGAIKVCIHVSFQPSLATDVYIDTLAGVEDTTNQVEKSLKDLEKVEKGLKDALNIFQVAA